MIGPLVLLLVLWQGSAGAPAAGPPARGRLVLRPRRPRRERLRPRAPGVGPPLRLSRLDRFSILLGKNLGVIALRLPALVAVSARNARSWPVRPSFPPSRRSCSSPRCSRRRPTTTSRSSSRCRWRPPGATRTRPSRGAAGLGAAAMVFVAMLATLLVSAPFVFLAWLPHLLGERWLWLAHPAARPRRRRGRVLHGHLGRRAASRAARARARRPGGGGGLRWRDGHASRSSGSGSWAARWPARSPRPGTA